MRRGVENRLVKNFAAFRVAKDGGSCSCTENDFDLVRRSCGSKSACVVEHAMNVELLNSVARGEGEVEVLTMRRRGLLTANLR